MWDKDTVTSWWQSYTASTVCSARQNSGHRVSEIPVKDRVSFKKLKMSVRVRFCSLFLFYRHVSNSLGLSKHGTLSTAAYYNLDLIQGLSSTWSRAPCIHCPWQKAIWFHSGDRQSHQTFHNLNAYFRLFTQPSNMLCQRTYSKSKRKRP